MYGVLCEKAGYRAATPFGRKAFAVGFLDDQPTDVKKKTDDGIGSAA
jgi:hypothetical protein